MKEHGLVAIRLPYALAGPTFVADDGDYVISLAVKPVDNKAQINMGVHTIAGSATGRLTAWAVVHNAANYTRDVVLQVVGRGPVAELHPVAKSWIVVVAPEPRRARGVSPEGRVPQGREFVSVFVPEPCPAVPLRMS